MRLENKEMTSIILRCTFPKSNLVNMENLHQMLAPIPHNAISITGLLPHRASNCSSVRHPFLAAIKLWRPTTQSKRAHYLSVGKDNICNCYTAQYEFRRKKGEKTMCYSSYPLGKCQKYSVSCFHNPQPQIYTVIERSHHILVSKSTKSKLINSSNS